MALVGTNSVGEHKPVSYLTAGPLETAARVPIPVLPLASWVVIGSSHNLSVPHLSHL